MHLLILLLTTIVSLCFMAVEMVATLVALLCAAVVFLPVFIFKCFSKE